MGRRVRGVVVVGVVLMALFGGVGVAGAQERGGKCERGEFCLWVWEGYRGVVHRVSLRDASPGECVGVPEGRSFANRGGWEVTVYQDGRCSTEGEFDTYPGGGTFVPEAPYVVRAIQIWTG